MTNRNEACSCGSGKKFKKCCGATTVAADTEIVEVLPAERAVLARRRFRFTAEVELEVTDISQADVNAWRASANYVGGDPGAAFFQRNGARQRRVLRQLMLDPELVRSFARATVAEDLETIVFEWSRQLEDLGSVETIEEKVLPNLPSREDREFWGAMKEDEVVLENLDLLIEAVRGRLVSARLDEIE